jgi:hypothetical protein
VVGRRAKNETTPPINEVYEELIKK